MLWRCLACTTRYAHSLVVCPHCGSTEREEDGVPKTSAVGGPSYAGHVDVSSPDTVTPDWAPAEPVTEPVEAVQPEPEPVKAEPRRKPKAGQNVTVQAGHAAGTGTANPVG